MSDSSKRSLVTVTLGRGGRVVKRAGECSDEGIRNGVPVAGGKRSIKDRLGDISEDRSDSYIKRKRGESTNNSIDMCLGEDDLRFKLMQKNTGQESQNCEPLRNVDLRDKLSSRTGRPSADSMAMRPPESAASMQHFLLDPRITGMARQPILESRDASILGRFPLPRNPSELPAIGPPQSYSSWTLENLRRRSPEGLRRRCPEGLGLRSPHVLRRRSPEVLRRRSPEGLRRRSPEGLRRRSPGGLRLRSPEDFRRRSPEGLRRRSPPGLRGISPQGLRRRSPQGLRGISPQGLRRRSPLGLKRISPESLRRRSPPQGLRRISPEGLRRRSPPQGLRRISPEGLRRRSPPQGLRRLSPEALRRRSPERLFHPSAARGLSPQSREDLRRRPTIRPYDDRGSTAFVRISPRRTVQSSPYLAQTSVPPPQVKSPVDAPPTVDSFLQSLGLEKYAIYFRAEEVDMNALRQLGDSDLRGLGIPMGPRKTILQAVMSRGRRQL